MSVRRARTSARITALAILASLLTLLPAGTAVAAVPARESDDVGMLDGLVRTIEVVGDRVWVGGTFTQMRNANGTPARTVSNLAVFDAATGAPDLTITIPDITRDPGVAVVYDLALGPDGLLYIGGAFDHVGGVVRRNIAAIDPTDGSVAPFSPGTSIVRSVLPTATAIYVGTSNLLSFQLDESPTPGFDPPQMQTDLSLRSHNTPPQVRDMELAGSTIVAACQCDSTVQGGVTRPAKAVIKVDANTGEVLDWTPQNLTAASGSFGISLLIENHPGTGERAVFLAAGGSDFTGAFDLDTAAQLWKTDTSGSSQVVGWFDDVLYVGGHFEYIAQTSGQLCGSNGNPNTACLRVPRLVALNPADGRAMPSGNPWNPGICCRYNGTWAIQADPARGHLHVGGEFTKVGGTWTTDGTTWTLSGASTQAFVARFSGTPTTVETLDVSIAGTGDGRVTSVPAGVDCTADCQAEFPTGTAVTLTAAADAGSTFTGWSGHCSGDGPCQVTMNNARSVTATFTADAPPVNRCGRITATTSHRGNADVYTMSAAGTARVRLTTGLPPDRDPAWSPDCTRIAFVSTRTGDPEVFVMDADGSNRQRLTHSEGADVHPAWSPDGARIAFTSTRTGNAEIFVMDADGANESNLTSNATRDGSPAWSPDGARIAFDSDRGGQTDIWTMTGGGGGLLRLTSGVGRSAAPSFSPDGATMAFVNDRSGRRQIWLMDADGTTPRRLTRDAGKHTHPSWSPTGTRLVYASTMSGHNQIWRIRADGTGAVNLSDNARIETTPAWS
ncbi:MAG TPA: hypothetical protein VNC60_00055 [Actinomycetota bacterium]|nr:hypothetical protein [Actinomycetota bacterium]